MLPFKVHSDLSSFSVARFLFYGSKVDGCLWLWIVVFCGSRVVLEL